MVEISRRGSTVVLGDDEVRIEEGPARKTAVATEELLHDDQTDARYYAGTRPMPLGLPDGRTVEVPAVGRDALGNPIQLGKKMTYLDHGGRTHAGSRCFYIMVKRPIDPTKEFYDDGARNPHYVPEHVRAGALLADDGTPPNRTSYEFVFEIADTRETEPEAIARGQELLAEKE